jgi:hypothetical protein
MKNKYLKFSLLLILMISCHNLKAQFMYVRPYSEAQSVYSVANIQKLTFSSGNLTVKDINGVNSIFTQADIRYINFTNLNLSLVEYSLDHIIKVYPNPVNNILHINIEDHAKYVDQIEIFSSRGQLILKQNHFNSNDPQVDVSKLLQGIYLCKITVDNNSKTIKFLKQ